MFRGENATHFQKTDVN